MGAPIKRQLIDPPAATAGIVIETQVFLTQVGERMRAIREQAGLSRRIVADRSGVSQRYLAQIESGAGNISIALLYRVSAAVGCSIESIVGTTHQTPASPRARRVCLIGLRGAGKSTPWADGE